MAKSKKQADHEEDEAVIIERMLYLIPAAGSNRRGNWATQGVKTLCRPDSLG